VRRVGHGHALGTRTRGKSHRQNEEPLLMVIFDERRKTFEERFKHEEGLRFKISTRSNRLFGEWATARLGLSAAEADDYAASVVHAQLDEPGVVAKVEMGLRTRGIRTPEGELQSKLARFAEEAKQQIMAE
jgi:hypothetical protein